MERFGSKTIECLIDKQEMEKVSEIFQGRFEKAKNHLVKLKKLDENNFRYKYLNFNGNLRKILLYQNKEVAGYTIEISDSGMKARYTFSEDLNIRTNKTLKTKVRSLAYVRNRN